MDEDDTLLDITDGLATVTLNRPDKANAMHPRQFGKIRDFFYRIEERGDVRCVLIRGAGKHFMAGGDLSTLTEFKDLGGAARARAGEDPIYDYNHMVQVMLRLEMPVIASVQGGVAGAAVGFTAACDLVICADTTFFWAAHILHGASNDGLLSYFLPRHIGLRKMLEMALMGERVYAPEAKELGLVNFVVPEADLERETQKLVQRFRDGPTKGYGFIKKLAYASLANSVETQGRLEAEYYGTHSLKTADVTDGLQAFFERRPPNFKGR